MIRKVFVGIMQLGHVQEFDTIAPQPVNRNKIGIKTVKSLFLQYMWSLTVF